MLTLDRQLIADRKAKLEETKITLKEHFVGIDKIIDDLIDYIQVWYLIPELLKRPVIVNLWGMTGVGKTDLVRKLVKSLHYQDRFVEVELSNVDETIWHSSVSAVLESYDLHDGKPAIVLFDEIQRFNTIDTDGKPLGQTKFMDFWEMLSDGRLSKKHRDNLDSFLMGYFQRRKDTQRKRSKGEEIDEEPIYLSMWEAIELRKTLNLDINVEDLLDMSEDEMVDLIMSAKRQKTIYEPINHSKTLILISGNLDDAFHMATQAAEADVDADIFHAFTTKVTLMDVKEALMNKFRPEQVARFGNIHLIYPSLRKQDFQTLIDREIERVCRETFEHTGVQLTLDDSIARLIYRNGVFPVQGVRPVFSSVTDILEMNLSKMLLHALTNNQTTISLKFDEAQQHIVAQVGDTHFEYPYTGRIDKIRQTNQQAAVANISVHESGHAVAYMTIFGLVPLQLQSKVASSYSGGFTFPHQIHRTKRSMLDMVKVFLAGGLAEEMIFGAYSASTGRENDREQASILVLDYVRKYGFDDEFQATYTLDHHAYAMNRDVTDLDVEKMMMRLVSETRELLSRHINLLQTLSLRLAESGQLESTVTAQLAAEHGVKVTIMPEGHLHILPYDQQLEALRPEAEQPKAS